MIRSRAATAILVLATVLCACGPNKEKVREKAQQTVEALGEPDTEKELAVVALVEVGLAMKALREAGMNDGRIDWKNLEKRAAEIAALTEGEVSASAADVERSLADSTKFDEDSGNFVTERNESLATLQRARMAAERAWMEYTR